MWAHHPSAWTAPTKKAEPQFVVVEDKKRKKLSKRRKIIIQMTIDRLTSLSDEHISIYTKFAKRWYLDRDEVCFSLFISNSSKKQQKKQHKINIFICFKYYFVFVKF